MTDPFDPRDPGDADDPFLGSDEPAVEPLEAFLEQGESFEDPLGLAEDGAPPPTPVEFYDQEVPGADGPAPGTVPAAEPLAGDAGTAVPDATAARPRVRNPRSRTPHRLGPARRNAQASPRFRIIAVIAALLIIGGLVDRTGASAGGDTAAALPAGPVAAPAGAESSSWFCAGATDGDSAATDAGGSHAATGNAPAQLDIANTNGFQIKADITLIPVSGGSAKPATQTVTVGAYDRLEVPETLPGSPAWIGASVTLLGGAAAVDQEITGSLGPSVSPCATSGSRDWYFTDGRTAINASDVITLLNPYSTDAIVDLNFTTNQGLEAPDQFQAIDVPADGLVALDLGTHLRRRTSIATVATVRSGRVIAWQTRTVTPVPKGTQTLSANGTAPAGAIDPASPVPGVDVSLGAPSAGRTWTWPDGIAGNGVDEEYDIYNPGPGVAQVSLALNLDQGTAEPFTLTIGAEQVSTIISQQQARVPAGVTHSAVLTSANGVPVVASREVAAAAPSPHLGLGTLLGERTPATSWLFAGGSVSANYDESLVLFNPGKKPVHASVDGLGGGPPAPLPGLGALVIGPGARLAVDLGAHQSPLASALTLHADGALYAERDLLGSSSAHPGYGLAAGVPLS